MTAERAFWDSSGVVLLCADQKSSGLARRLRTTHGSMAVWWGMRLEVRSALWRLYGEGGLDDRGLAASVKRLTRVASAALEVTPSETVRRLAEAVIERFSVRAADALQLAAALVACREEPRARPFVCFDVRLATAAERAGFTALPSQILAAR